MAEHATQFEATEGGMILTDAILLYRADAVGDRPGKAFASIHKVAHGDRGPEINAGRPLTRGHLRHWTDVLRVNATPEILPGNVLVAHADLLAWWVPEQVRKAWFDLSNPPEGLKALGQRTTVPVPYPAHLFVATRRGLGVYALPENKRPDAATRVLYSPVLNVFVTGQLCWGNVARPKRLTVEALPEFESAVFDSWSTHPNPGQERTVTGRGGLVRLWDELAARGADRFPVKRLKAFEGRTLHQIVAEAAR